MLHSSTFTYEMVIIVMKIISDCKDLIEKDTEYEIVNSAFRKRVSTFVVDSASQGNLDP